MQKLLKYMKEYRKEAVSAPLFKLLEACFDLMVPLVMARIIDVGIRNQDFSYILRMCLLMVALGVIGLACSVTAQYFSAKAACGFTAKIRSELFRHIQSFSFSEMDKAGTSTLITRMTSDLNQLQTGVNLFLRLFMRSPFIVIGAMVMAFTIDFRSALVFVVVIPLLCVIVFGIMLIGIPLYRKVQEHLDAVLRLTRENLEGVRVIRAFRREEKEIKDFEKENGLLVKIQLFSGRISALMNPLTYVVINAGLVALLYVGAIRVNAGAITQGSLVALVNYMSQILVELVKLANLIITVTRAIACGNRVEDVMERPAGMEIREDLRPAKSKTQAETVPAVEFDHVSMRYSEGADEALTDVDFKAGRGQTVGIIGGTGSGKSTLVHLIPRFYDVSAGSVRVDGVDVRAYSPDKLRADIGIVMQKAVLFQGTIRSNLIWGNSSASDEELLRALKTAQAEDIAGDEEELDKKVEQDGRNFSGGQRQRLTIARALVRHPKILILDDSASALDFATDARLRRALNSLKSEEDMTVFIVSQRTSSIAQADQILVLDDGRVAGIGTHEELLENCVIYREIHEAQFPKEVRA